MTTISVFIVATGNYKDYVIPLAQSIRKHFMTRSQVYINVFTDDMGHFHDVSHVLINRCHYVEHKPWPHATLKRFHFFNSYINNITDSDYYFYIDADTLVCADIPEEILSPIMAVRHCGFMNKRGTYETNPKSTSYVAPNEGKAYFGGGFWGMDKANFWAICEKAKNMIDEDLKNGIIPVHHDESVLNKILISHQPTMILPPEYHYPQSNIEKYRSMWGRDYICRILLLDKDHAKMREFKKEPYKSLTDITDMDWSQNIELNYDIATLVQKKQELEDSLESINANINTLLKKRKGVKGE